MGSPPTVPSTGAFHFLNCLPSHEVREHSIARSLSAQPLHRENSSVAFFWKRTKMESWDQTLSSHDRPSLSLVRCGLKERRCPSLSASLHTNVIVQTRPGFSPEAHCKPHAPVCALWVIYWLKSTRQVSVKKRTNIFVTCLGDHHKIVQNGKGETPPRGGETWLYDLK